MYGSRNEILKRIAAQQQFIAEQQRGQDLRDSKTFEHKPEEARKAFQDYGVQRQQDIARALSRRICTGDAGLPFLMIDTVFATVVLGEEKYQTADLGSALEGVKDKLWQQCRHLGGDAVLFADFKFEKGRFSFVSGLLATIGLLSSAMRLGGMNPTVTQDTITVVGQGTAVKLLPTGTDLGPQVYEQFDPQWLDMRLPPGVEPPP